VLSYWYYLIQKKKILFEIQRKFPVPGPSFLDDSDSGVIERGGGGELPYI
jgi:hypothetical protein